MEKLVRVSNCFRGKKLIISNGNLEDFISSVRLKFSLEPELEIVFEDEEGAEIDPEVFPILVSQHVIPNIRFLVNGEQPEVEVTTLTADSAGNNSIVAQYFGNLTSSLTSQIVQGPISAFGLDQLVQILESYIQTKPEVNQLISDCISTGCVDSAASSQLIKEFVAKLIELKGESPTPADQKLLAQAIIQIIPVWKYTASTSGIDILYDDVNRCGLIQARLRNIHKGIKGDGKAKKPKRVIAVSGGPKPKVLRTDVLNPTEIDHNLIVQLNSTPTKDGNEELKRLMLETLPHRNFLRTTSDTSILKLYTKFGVWDQMVNYEFSLLHPEEENNFLLIWPKLSERILEQCKKITKSPTLIKFLNDDAGKWDSSVIAIFALLHLIPPSAQGRGKATRCKIDDAKQRIIAFHKTGTPLKSILDTWSVNISQPTLLCLGETPQNLSSFFIICDRILIPLSAQNSLQALDSLFKSHFVFGTEYDTSLLGMWKFIQVYVYQIDADSTNLPRKVKEVYSQLQSILVN